MLHVFCSIFYEKEGFYCQPKELPSQEYGGVAVALGQKVSSSCGVFYLSCSSTYLCFVTVYTIYVLSEISVKISVQEVM